VFELSWTAGGESTRWRFAGGFMEEVSESARAGRFGGLLIFEVGGGALCFSSFLVVEAGIMLEADSNSLLG
jgi:hypothetical protein